MTRTTSTLTKTTLAVFVGVCCFLGNDEHPLPGSLVTEAHARIGRPLTPLSYAGVARRTARRGWAGAAVGLGVGAAAGVAVGAAAAAPYASGCFQAVDAYGRIYTRCP